MYGIGRATLRARPRHRAAHDTPRFVPGDPRNPTRAGHRAALLNQIDEAYAQGIDWVTRLGRHDAAEQLTMSLPSPILRMEPACR
jgi:hypothetical protein